MHSIQEVARQLSVSEDAIREWEAALPEFVASLGEGERRVYGPDAVRALSQARALVKGQGYSVAQVRRFFSDARQTDAKGGRKELLRALDDVREALCRIAGI
jgi:DNA-binding transcriptional MerR regulator